MHAIPDELSFPWPEPPPFGEVLEVAPGILWTRLPLPFRLDHVNVYLLEDVDGWVIFDAGINDERTRALWEELIAGPLADRPIKRLIVSHHHPDHIGLAGWLCKRLGIPLSASQTAYLACINISLSPWVFEAKSHLNFYRSNGMQEDVAALVGTQGQEYLTMISGVPDMFTRIVARDRLQIGQREFTVLTGDGHAPEQIMLFSASDGILLAADQVIAKITPNVGVWAVEPDGDPLGLFLRSLDDLIAQLPEDVLVLPGHQMPFRGLHIRCRQLREHHASRCALILDSCSSGPRTVADLVPVLFTRPLDPHQMSFAFAETHAHVNYLVRRRLLAAVASQEHQFHFRAI